MKLEKRPGPLLAERTTLRLGGRARLELVAPSAESLEDLPLVLVREGLPPFMLGKGSNILAGDGDMDLALVSLEETGKPELLSQDGTSATVRAPGGMALPRFLGFLAALGLGGLEGLAGIPGSVGGAVAMNAGSYAQCVADCLSRVRVMTLTSGLQWLEPGEWSTGYRTFTLKEDTPWFVVAEAEFRLTRSDSEFLVDRLRQVLELKKASQPITARTAGSTFKNPSPGTPAGRLLDEAGLKGLQLGGMGFSEQHANFLVNLGQGTGAEALELIALARERVKERFGHDLELEVTVIG